MNLCIALVLVLFLSVEGVVEYLPRGMKMKFYFPTADEVQFEWWIPMTTLEPYEWIGFAIQDSKFARNNFKADYYIALKGEGLFRDFYLDHEGNPVLDTDLGGTDDVIESCDIQHNNYMVYGLRRKLVTGDKFDTVLLMEKPYMIKWALGTLDDGVVLRHKMLDIGFEYFVLADGYEDRNQDERETYGPFLDYPPEYNNPPFERKPENYEWSMMIEEFYTGQILDPDNIYMADGLIASEDEA